MRTDAPATLNSRHLLAAALEAAGYTDAEIATRLRFAKAHISRIRQSPLYHAAVLRERAGLRAQIRETVAERLNGLAPVALDTVERLMAQNDNPGVALGAATTVLDRVLPKAKEGEGKPEVRVTFTLEESQRLRRVLIEDAAADRGDVIDVVPVSQETETVPTPGWAAEADEEPEDEHAP